MTRVLDFLLAGILSPSCEEGAHQDCPGRSAQVFQGRRHITVCVCEHHDDREANVYRVQVKTDAQKDDAIRSMAGKLGAAKRNHRTAEEIAGLERELDALRKRTA